MRKKLSKLAARKKKHCLDRTVNGVVVPSEFQLLSANNSELFLILGQGSRTRGSARSRSGHSNAESSQANAEKVSLLKALCDVFTDAWRIRKKIVDSATDEPKNDELRRLYRHVESIYATMEEVGIEIVDPAGEKYDPGMALKVIAFEEKQGVMKDEIVETMKPTVRWNGQFLQVGEVIVGTPKKA
jgi:molecular chaperone GrpE (heat shock protein)